jgi:hypothetical protein
VTQWYTRAFKAFKSIIGPTVIPHVFLTDREPALAAALSTIYPDSERVYCLWHILKNIATNCKTGLTKEEYDGFIADWLACIQRAPSEEALAEGILMIAEKYKGEGKEQFRGIIGYTEQLMDHKTYFIQAWTDQWLHLGNRNTSRGEGAHWSLKNTLALSSGDFVMVTERVKAHMEHEWIEVTARMERDRVRIVNNAPRLMYNVSPVFVHAELRPAEWPYICLCN